MPKSRKPTETKTVSATKKAAGTEVAPEAAKAASRSSMTKKTSQPVAKKPDDAPAPVPGAKKTTAAHGPKATTQSHRDTHPGDGRRVTTPDRSEFLAEQRVMLSRGAGQLHQAGRGAEGAGRFARPRARAG